MSVTQESIQSFHSQIRWNKGGGELKQLMRNTNLINAKDIHNGNTAIHIAVQNGHRKIVQRLVQQQSYGAACNVNATNYTGQTALHMALEYDYWFIAKFLIEQGGADVSIKNHDGYSAETGITGTKSLHNSVTILSDAITKEEIDYALNAISYQVVDHNNNNNNKQNNNIIIVDKAELVQVGMMKKKSMQNIWSKEHNTKFIQLVQSI